VTQACNVQISELSWATHTESNARREKQAD
jgi:hypothetical protein